MLKCRYIEPGKYTWNEHFTMPQLHQDLVPEVVEIFYTNKHFCRFYTCIQNQIIDKHVYVYHNPSTGMLVLIVSLQLSIVPYAAGPESWCHSMRLYIDVNCFPSLTVRWILTFMDQPTHENWYWPSNFNNIFDWKNLKKIYLICLLHTNILAWGKT